MGRVTDFVGNVVGDNSVTLEFKNRERVSDGVIYTWKVTILQFNEGRPKKLAESRVKARSIAKAIKDMEGVTNKKFLQRFTRVYSPKEVDSADFTTVYEYQAKVLTGER